MEDLQRLFLVIITAVLCFTGTKAQTGVQVVVYHTGTYELKVKNVPWMKSAPTFFVLNGQRYGDDDGSLKVESVHKKAFDKSPFGEGVSTDITFRAGNETIVASVLSYALHEVLSFKVNFVDGASDINHPNYDAVICGFPGFILDGSLTYLGFMELGGEFAGFEDQSFGKWNKSARITGGLEGASQMTLFDKSFNAITIGPMDNYMATNMWHDTTNDHVYWGLMGGIAEVPENFTYQTLIGYANNPQTSMGVWGFAMRSALQLKRPQDATLDGIGYWTGEGSFYFHEAAKATSYEDAILQVFAEAKNKSIPYKYVELDTWWFTKGQGGGVKNWTAPTSVFPNGLANLHNKIGVPFAAKNNFWSADTDYAKKNGGQYNFDISGDMAIPTDEAFWDFLFSQAKVWGMTAYIQDNMTQIFKNFKKMKTDLDYAKNWLTIMGNAAKTHGITIHYSGALPRMVLQTMDLPAVTQVRVSANYGADPNQWKIGLTSTLAEEVEIGASKDGFLSQIHEGATGDPNAERQSLVSALSKGPVATGDMAWGSNTTLIMKSCRQDGTILKSHVPAVAIEGEIIQRAFQDGSGPTGEVWSSYSSLDKDGTMAPAQTYGIIFASNLNGKYSITPGLAGFTFQYPKSKIFSVKDPRKQHDFTNEQPFVLENCPADGFCVYYTAPVINLNNKEVLILGELEKWIPMSRQRINKVTVTDTIQLDVMGKPNEKVEIWFAVNGEIGALAIVVGGNGHSTLVFEDNYNAGPTLRGSLFCVITPLLMFIVRTFSIA